MFWSSNVFRLFFCVEIKKTVIIQVSVLESPNFHGFLHVVLHCICCFNIPSSYIIIRDETKTWTFQRPTSRRVILLPSLFWGSLLAHAARQHVISVSCSTSQQQNYRHSTIKNMISYQNPYNQYWRLLIPMKYCRIIEDTSTVVVPASFLSNIKRNEDFIIRHVDPIKHWGSNQQHWVNVGGSWCFWVGF